MHNAAFAQLQLDFVYRSFAIPPGRLAAAIDGARALFARGLNVTVPYKEAALALCSPDAQARAVGAVNTLVFDDHQIRGHNTDVYGFDQLVNEVCPDARTGRVVVLGAGGAARAVAAALLPTARSVLVLSRTARPLDVDGAKLDVLPWSTLAETLPTADLLVDATSRALTDADPVDLSPLQAHAAVLDLTVKRTTLLDDAQARGLRCAGGATMLLHQGARAFELWTGAPAPVEVMRQALLRTL